MIARIIFLSALQVQMTWSSQLVSHVYISPSSSRDSVNKTLVVAVEMVVPCTAFTILYGGSSTTFFPPFYQSRLESLAASTQALITLGACSAHPDHLSNLSSATACQGTLYVVLVPSTILQKYRDKGKKGFRILSSNVKVTGNRCT